MEGSHIINNILNTAMTMLKSTSRTFYIPISRLEPGLKEAVSSAYLCMRAIDEIEDHPELSGRTKAELLDSVSEAIRAQRLEELSRLLLPYKAELPQVTLQLEDWLRFCPESIAPTVYRYIAMMSEQMAEWVRRDWAIHTEEDLDGYTYSVAGMVGEMLSELWAWHDGTTSDLTKAVAFGRGLQAVNIIRNRKEDLERGVDYYPDGWGQEEMLRYTRRNLQTADAYIADLKKGPALEFCKIPLALAHATVKIIAAGGIKLTRANVLDIVSRVTK
ncbi:hypothetical protein PAESOLCIP111_00249 [Paenibacillus solanacearum]|uniref:Phytoene/squalene synthase family protein n=1 Tax=Paenibacillus solanacearum TaxID=2048548 RepID=A0A916JTW3_9BACL|nr:phytoene/squalene synthase family protein [Paenibacillus solanacearum]CAG7598698.1 hypothetical protein PAESOLCIP111_00249 [Paenibacillus solanacearum]